MKLFDIFQKNDYRSKLQLLLWSILPIFIVCYFFAFKKTFTTIRSYNYNQEMVAKSASLKDSLDIYKNKQKAITDWQKQYMLDSAILDGQVLAAINTHCRELGLQFKEYKPMGTNNQHVWTRMITVQGDFKAILRLLYNLEQTAKICRVASVQYKNIKLNNESGDELHCSIYIQNIIKK